MPIEFEDRCGQREKFGGSLGDGPGEEAVLKQESCWVSASRLKKFGDNLGWTGLFIL